MLLICIHQYNMGIRMVKNHTKIYKIIFKNKLLSQMQKIQELTKIFDKKTGTTYFPLFLGLSFEIYKKVLLLLIFFRHLSFLKFQNSWIQINFKSLIKNSFQNKESFARVLFKTICMDDFWDIMTRSYWYLSYNLYYIGNDILNS